MFPYLAALRETATSLMSSDDSEKDENVVIIISQAVILKNNFHGVLHQKMHMCNFTLHFYKKD